MPQMVALFNGVGGGAAALVAMAEFHSAAGADSTDAIVSTVLSALIGSISFAGSIVAFAKLQELVSGRPITFPGQNVFNVLVLLVRRRARHRARSPASTRSGCSSALIVARARSSASSSCCRSAAPTCRS